MSSTPLYVDRSDPAGEPGALVAAWLLGELLDVPHITVALAGDDTLTLQVGPDAATLLRSRVQGLLTEPRFVSWQLRPA